MPDWLISVLNVARLKAYVASAGRYAAVQAVLFLVLMVLIGLAAAFALTALTIWLVTLWGLAIAFAAMAGGFLVVALLLEIVIVVRRRRWNKRKRTSAPRSEMPSDQAAFGTIAAIAIIGYVLGRQLMRR